MKIGIIGVGMVGSAYMEGLQRLEFDVVGYDKYKEEYHLNMMDVISSDVIFICLPTVPKKNGTMDTSPFDEVFQHLVDYHYTGLIIIKSTLLPGTTKKYYKKYKLNIVHSPEFLSESQALYDVLNPTRIVVGLPSDEVPVDDFLRIHRIFRVPIIETDSNTSEFAKFMQNAFFATKVTFANEMNEISKIYGADYNRAKEIMYFEKDVGNNHLSINRDKSFGGHCLPKDSNQLLADLTERGIKPILLTAAKEVNEREVKLTKK